MKQYANGKLIIFILLLAMALTITGPFYADEAYENVFEDTLDDFSKVYSKTNNWLVKSDIEMPDDPTRIYRSTDVPENIIYKSEKPITGYMIKVYNLLDLKETLQVYLSSDGENWNKMGKKIAVEDGITTNWLWTYVTPENDIKEDVYYLKIEALDEPRGYTPQISHVEYYTGGLKNKPQKLEEKVKIYDPYASSEYAESIKLLLGMGIIESAELDEHVTRGQYASLISRMLQLGDLEGIIESNKLSYTDLPSSHANANNIYLLSYLGLMRGYADGTFCPDESITYEQALTVLVRALGYASIVKNDGGNTDAYPAFAAQLGLTNKLALNIGDHLKTDQAAQLIFNGLRAKPLVADGAFNYVLGQSDLMTDKFGISRKRGQITETRYGKIAGASTLKANQVTIDALVYQTEDENIQNMLGYGIDYYYTVDDEGMHKLISYSFDDSDSVLVVEADEVMINDTSFSINRFVYQDGERTLSKNMNIRHAVKNGQRQIFFDKSIFQINNGSVTLIDSDRDTIYETVLVEEYHHYIVESIDRLNLAIVGRYNNEALPLEAQNSEKINYLKNGKPSDFDTIRKKDVLSVARSHDNIYTKVIITSVKITGTIESSDSWDSSVVIEGNAYKVLTGPSAPLIGVGTKGSFYMDANGIIVGVDAEATNTNYAFLLATSINKSINKNLQLKVFGENGEFYVLDCVQPVTIDNGIEKKRYTTTEAYKLLSHEDLGEEEPKTKEQLIKYDLNSDNLVQTIYLAKLGQEQGVFSLNYKDSNAFSSVNGLGILGFRYAVGRAKIFVIPSNRDNYWEYKNTYRFIEGDMRPSSSDPKYDVEIYDSDTMNQASALVVYKSPSEGSVQIAVINTPLAVVKRITSVYDEITDKTVNRYYFSSRNNEVSYTASEVLSVEAAPEGESDPKMLKPGDIVQMGYDSEGKIARMIMHYKAEKGLFNLGSSRVDGFGENNTQSSDLFIMHGGVINVSSAYLLADAGMGIRLIGIGSANITIFNQENSSVRAGTASDILIGDKVVVRSSKTNAGEVIIIR